MGLWISRATVLSSAEEFISTIRPKNTNHELVRFGSKHDGGYLIPDDLDGIEACFSAGVGRVVDFERDMANRGIKCFLADYSTDGPPIQNDLFDFEKKYVGTRDDTQSMTLQKWVEKKVPGSGDLILQMDIEGAEYAVIMASSLDILTRFRILVIEFHNFDAIYDRYGLGLIDLAFQKLLQQFEIVHIHPNNIRPLINYAGYQAPPLVEFTFLRKDRILNQRPASMFPHVLDRANVPQNHDYPLPRCWFE